MPHTYIVVNRDGLYVRSMPSTSNPLTILRRMAMGEAFTAFEIFHIANQTWARLTEAGTRSNEYACITYANREPFAIPADQNPPAPSWAAALDEWARMRGYTGPRP